MRVFLIVVGVVLLGAGVASANGVGVFGTYWNVQDGGDDGFGAGAKLQFEVMPNICLEARGSYFPDFGDTSIDIIPAEADAIIKFPLADQLTPYVGGGAGYYMFAGDDEGVDDEFGWFALAGLEFGLSQELSLFAEGKYTWLDVNGGNLDGFGGNAGIMMKW